MATEELDRRKRLRLLREAKERKQRQANDSTDEPKESNDQNQASNQLNAAEKPQVKDQGSPIPLEDQRENMEEQPVADVVMKDAEKTEHEDEEEEEEEEEDDDDALSLAPKKANWDIERDIAPMLKRLEKRTQKAIVEILREKIAAQQQEDEGDEENEEEEEEQDGEEEEQEQSR